MVLFEHKMRGSVKSSDVTITAFKSCFGSFNEVLLQNMSAPV